jgi:hypothetical protein
MSFTTCAFYDRLNAQTSEQVLQDAVLDPNESGE